MSRHRTVRQIEDPDDSREAVIEELLDELCVRLGFCVSPDDKAALRNDPPAGVDAFSDAVIRAAGVDPVLIDGDLRRQMVEVVALGAGQVLERQS